MTNVDDLAPDAMATAAVSAGTAARPTPFPHTQADLDRLVDQPISWPVAASPLAPFGAAPAFDPIRAFVARGGYSVTLRRLLHAVGCKTAHLPSRWERECVDSAKGLFYAGDWTVPTFRDEIRGEVLSSHTWQLGVGMALLAVSDSYHVAWDELVEVPPPRGAPRGARRRTDYRGAANGVRLLVEAKGTAYLASQDGHIGQGLAKKADHRQRQDPFDVGLTISTWMGHQASPGRRILVGDPPESRPELFTPETTMGFRFRHYARVVYLVGERRLARALLRRSWNILEGRPPARWRLHPLEHLTAVRSGNHVFRGRWLPDDESPSGPLRLGEGREVRSFFGIADTVLAQLNEGRLPDGPVSWGMWMQDGGLAIDTGEGEPLNASVFPDGTVMVLRAAGGNRPPERQVCRDDSGPSPKGSGGTMAVLATTPEQKARVRIDAALVASGWLVHDNASKNILAGAGVAVREFPLTTGFADYLLFVNGQAVGALEAKPEGHTLAGVEPQAAKYSHGLPAKLVAPVTPLPFLYISTGAKTRFINLLDPKPRTRDVFQIHRPETLAEWLKADTLDQWVKALHLDGSGLYTAAEATKPSSLRSRIATLANVEAGNLYANQIEAIVGLEKSLKQDKPRALIQMATGSGKTIMAVTALYRLIKFGGARRVLFLVDRQNLAEQAEREFQGYRTPDDNRKFTDLYKVQRLTTNTISSSTKVVITTVQRLYSMLKGEPDLPPEQEDGSAFDHEDMLPKEPLPVVYNAAISPEYFDVIVIDECHRSIYSLWRQVLDYFDAYLVGLTATPAKHTYGFFNQNLVMEYPHERAVADRVNVDFEVYKIRTKITELGSTIEKTNTVDIRDRGTTQQRWLKDDVVYTGNDLDRSVVATDQIRLIARTYRDRLPTELFPGRKEVPKTLVFAKDDQHAEDIVEVLRQEFGEGNAFCQKITYKTTGAKTADLIQAFRNEFNPRIAVTVDMIATGTDIRPIEVVIFLREVKSRVLFEQMKGRGVRVIDPNELRSVTPSASAKTHFLVIDCVGVTEGDLPDTQPLERKKTVPFKSLLEHVASGGTDPDVLSSLASRLARLDKVLLPAESKKVHEAAGASLASITATLVAALDPDQHAAKARQVFGLPDDADPTVAQKTEAANVLMKEAVLPLVTLPDLRKLLVALKTSHEQIIDHVSKDELLHDKTGFSKEAKDKAMQTAIAFETWLTDSKDEIDALQFFFSVPHRDRLRFADIKALAEAIHKPPRSWTPEALWRAYETLDQKKVKGAGGQRMLTDVVSLVRFALHQDGELVPYAERVRDRFDNWIAQQENGGRRFTDHQVRWLEMMRDHIAGSAEIGVDDFDATPFAQAGGLWRARELFGAELHGVLRDLNEAVAA